MWALFSRPDWLLAPLLPPDAAVADYDGVLSQVDMESGHLVAEVDEHSGRRCVRGVGLVVCVRRLTSEINYLFAEVGELESS